jgi:hypothetical protein
MLRAGTSVNLYPIHSVEFEAQFPSIDSKNLTMTPNSNCNATLDSQCLQNIHACGQAFAPCIHFDLKNRKAPFGKPQSFYTDLYYTLGPNSLGADQNCFNRSTIIRPGGQIVGPSFDAYRMMILVDDTEGFFANCPKNFQALWLPSDQWNEVVMSPSVRTKLNGEKVRGFYPQE